MQNDQQEEGQKRKNLACHGLASPLPNRRSLTRPLPQPAELHRAEGNGKGKGEGTERRGPSPPQTQEEKEGFILPSILFLEDFFFSLSCKPFFLSFPG
jgi:hypothetical protein